MKFTGGITTVAILVFGLMSGALWANEKSKTDLLKELKDLQKRVEALENTPAKSGAKKKAAASGPNTLTAGYFGKDLESGNPYGRHGFVIETLNKRYSMYFSGYLAATYTHHEANTRSNNEFNFKFAKFALDAFLPGDWRVRVEPFYAQRGLEGRPGNGGNLLDAFVENTYYDFFRVKAGQIFVPFGIENQTDENDLLTIHHSPISLSGGRFWDRGLMISGLVMSQYLEYSVGVFNGAGINNSNVNDDLMYAAQLRFFPLTADHHGQTFFHIAVERTREGLRNGRADFRTSTGFEVFDTTGNNPGLAARANGQGFTTAVSVGGRYYEKPLRLEGELIYREISREFDAGRQPKLFMYGWYLGGSYFISLAKDKHYGPEPVLKISYIQVGDKGGQISTPGQSMFEWTLGSKFHFNRHVRAEFNWVISYLKNRGSGTSSTVANQGIVSNKKNKSGGLIHTLVFQLAIRW